ncbi:hypothetical protein NDU88_004410, partial [Pleurodeles waltl]
MRIRGVHDIGPGHRNSDMINLPPTCYPYIVIMINVPPLPEGSAESSNQLMNKVLHWLQARSIFPISAANQILLTPDQIL